jgi:hypothetical protein
MPLTGTQAALSISGTLTGALDLQTLVSALTFTRGVSLDSGTGANQADKIFSDTRTLGASATEDLDLAGGLTDAFGASITFARVKIIAVSAIAGNTNDVVLGAAATNTFVGPFGAATHTVKVRPSGFVCFACSDATGWVVTASTADLLRVGNGGAGTGVTYDIVIIGTSV